ncbi:ABC-2 family transporter protein [Anaerosphaera aminiphila DSM 21120]|uniref:ABC-2 family transporter protein n=1 Tax=Anaerosphaera aminiphila DSM 21120 TaxID=1120995 RepID=A0A1M5SLB9_9FIRM|nr:ABC-2 transporter permease [Anaerosphaera aminiphila]SHH38703.1 ABC-2 family transporter protein [Anaerosphaera aminiphila DSM 21120]
MKGLIYKEFQLFLKSIDKKLIIIAGAGITFLMIKLEVYAGLLATLMLAMVIGMQSVMSFASDEKVNWKRYQLAMPVNEWRSVASKYISVILTLGVSVLVSIILFLVSSAVSKTFDITILQISVVSAIILPMVLTGVCLPLTYWFGFRSAQTMSLIGIVPVVYLISYFEDSPNVTSLIDSTQYYFLVSLVAVVIIFIISYVVSVMGYLRKK